MKILLYLGVTMRLLGETGRESLDFHFTSVGLLLGITVSTQNL